MYVLKHIVIAKPWVCKKLNQTRIFWEGLLGYVWMPQNKLNHLAWAFVYTLVTIHV